MDDGESRLKKALRLRQALINLTEGEITPQAFREALAVYRGQGGIDTPFERERHDLLEG